MGRKKEVLGSKTRRSLPGRYYSGSCVLVLPGTAKHHITLNDQNYGSRGTVRARGNKQQWSSRTTRTAETGFQCRFSLANSREYRKVKYCFLCAFDHDFLLVCGSSLSYGADLIFPHHLIYQSTLRMRLKRRYASSTWTRVVRRVHFRVDAVFKTI